MNVRVGYWQNDQDQAWIATALKKGYVLVGDTDTIPGLFALPNEQGVAQLNAIKGRSNKPYLLLLDTIEQLDSFVQKPIAEDVIRVLHAYWPGPLTVIFPAHESVPRAILSPSHKVGIRMPHHDAIRAVAGACGGLLSTSANSAGAPSPQILSDVSDDIQKQVIGIVRNHMYEAEKKPSTIIEITNDGLRLIREGAIAREKIEQIYGAPLQQ